MTHRSLEAGFIGTMQTKNRFVFPGMVTNYCDEEGNATDRFAAYHLARARGGAGLIIFECSEIVKGGRSFMHQLSIADDKFIPGLKKLTSAIQAEGARVAIQLYYPGRQTSEKICGRQPMAPSEVSYNGETAREMTVEDIQFVVHSFGEAAVRARQAGFDAIELHAGNGYLMQQFLSRFTNRRTDAYGGSLGNRTRFTIEVIREIRSRIGDDFPIIVRLGAAEPVENGLTVYEAACFARILSKEKIDAIHVTEGMREGGFLVTPPACMPEGTHLDAAKAIKEASGLPVIGIGRIHDVDFADKALEEGKADFFVMGRALIADPDIIRKTEEGRKDEIRPCLSCNEGCIGQLSKGRDIGCVINPFAGREYLGVPGKAESAQNIVIVGGGPAGCEAALAARRCGHKVTLLEKSEKLGGKVRLAAIPPFKNTLLPYAEYLENMVKKSGTDIRLGVTADAGMIAGLHPDLVILAGGAAPFVPPIPGIKECPSITSEQALLSDPSSLPDDVIVLGGGMVGSEIAEKLAETGKSVTVVEMRDGIAIDVEPRTRGMLLDRMQQLGITMLTGAAVSGATARSLQIKKCDDVSEITIKGIVVMAFGYRSSQALAQDLTSRGIRNIAVGDADRAANIMKAVRQGCDAGSSI